MSTLEIRALSEAEIEAVTGGQIYTRIDNYKTDPMSGFCGKAPAMMLIVKLDNKHAVGKVMKN